ncbi:MAG: hypothetical protein Q3W74_01745, partial [Veillonella sp.]|nr:hypothetical protein [Veillonella sp.]
VKAQHIPSIISAVGFSVKSLKIFILTSYDKADISPPISYPTNTLIKITNPNIKATSDTPMIALKNNSCINLTPYLLAFASLLAIALKSFVFVCSWSISPVYVPIGVHIYLPAFNSSTSATN